MTVLIHSFKEYLMDICDSVSVIHASNGYIVLMKEKSDQKIES
jgi:hypothetical protein